VVARGIQLGGAQLTLAPADTTGKETDALTIRGDLFDRFHVDSRVALGAAGPAVHGVVEFQRIALEALAPELAELGDGRGIASGRVAVDLEPGRPLAVDLLLTELAVSIARAIEGAEGETTVQRVRVSTASPCVSVRGQSVELDEVLFATDGGTLKARGRLDGDGGRLDGEMSGHLDLELLQPFLGTSVDKLSGDLSVQLGASGTISKPILRGAIDVAHAVTVRPHGFATDLTLGSGSFKLDNDGVRIDGLTLTAEGATMKLSGSAGLGPGFQPQDVHVDLAGDISARLLSYVAPDSVSDPQGTARIRARVRGTLAKPEVLGRIDLGTIDFRVRTSWAPRSRCRAGWWRSATAAWCCTTCGAAGRRRDAVIGASGSAGGSRSPAWSPSCPARSTCRCGERLTYRVPGVAGIDDLAFDLDARGHRRRFELGARCVWSPAATCATSRCSSWC
jgi:hypothetical protein